MIPIVIRATSGITGLQPRGAGLLAGFVCGLAGAVLVWILTESVYGRDAADGATALVSPGTYVLSMVYSETLLIPLGVGCLIALRHRRWLTAGVLGAATTAVDPIGSAIVAPAALAAFLAIRDRRQWGALASLRSLLQRESWRSSRTCGPTPAPRSPGSSRSDEDAREDDSEAESGTSSS